MIPIRIEPLFWLLAFGIGYLNSGTMVGMLLWAGVIAISVLFHEYGHALTALAFGQRPRITLMALGGVTSRVGPHISAFKEFLIVLNGPLAGFFLYFICQYASSLPLVQAYPNLNYALNAAIFVNLFWTIVNLIPVQPLDGGHLLMIAFRGLFGPRGVQIAYLLSIVLATLGAIFFFLMQQLLAGSLFLIFAFDSYRSFRTSLLMAPEDEKDEIKNELEQAVKLFQKGRKSEALPIAQSIRQKTGKGLSYITATVLEARILEDENNYDEAFRLLAPEESKLDPAEQRVLQRLAFESHRFKDAIRIGNDIHRETGFADVALVNAFSHAQLNEQVPALRWLETALRDGMENVSTVLNDPALDPIRALPEFKKIESQAHTQQ